MPENTKPNLLKPMYRFGKIVTISLMGFVCRVLWVLKALWIVFSETIDMLRKLHKTKIFGLPLKFYHTFMYIAPSSGHTLLDLNLPFKLILRRSEVDVWSENNARFEGFMEIHSNPPILYYGFNKRDVMINNIHYHNFKSENPKKIYCLLTDRSVLVFWLTLIWSRPAPYRWPWPGCCHRPRLGGAPGGGTSPYPPQQAAVGCGGRPQAAQWWTAAVEVAPGGRKHVQYCFKQIVKGYVNWGILFLLKVLIWWNFLMLYAVKVRRHTPWSRVRCHGCWFTHSQFHSQFHSWRYSLRITLKYTTLVRMCSGYAWTMKPWQRSEWHLGFNSVLSDRVAT